VLPRTGRARGGPRARRPAIRDRTLRDGCAARDTRQLDFGRPACAGLRHRARRLGRGQPRVELRLRPDGDGPPARDECQDGRFLDLCRTALRRRSLVPLRYGVRWRLRRRSGRTDGRGRCRRGCRRSLDRRGSGRRLGGRAGCRRRRRRAEGGPGGRGRRHGRGDVGSGRLGRRRRRSRLSWSRRRDRRGSRSDERGENRQWIEIALRVGRHAEAQMDVRGRHLRYAARPDRSDVGAFLDDDALENADRPQVGERDGVAVGGLDRERPAVRRHGAREGDGSRRRRPDEVAGGGGAQVDAPVLAAGVRVRAERERSQHGPGDRPRPRLRCRGEREQGERAGTGESSHLSSSLSDQRTECATVATPSDVVNTDYSEPR